MELGDGICSGTLVGDKERCVVGTVAVVVLTGLGERSIDVEKGKEDSLVGLGDRTGVRGFTGNGVKVGCFGGGTGLVSRLMGLGVRFSGVIGRAELAFAASRAALAAGFNESLLLGGFTRISPDSS